MARDDGRGNKRPTIIIRKEEVIEGGHHGGAWKVAYADFVTAMMAFFLLMWLLNATTEEQRKGLADYFSPTSVLSHNSSGTGQPFGGHTAFDKGAMVSDRGAALVTVGKTPVPMEADEDDSDTPATTVTFRKPTPKEKSQRDDEQDAPAPGNGGDVSASPAATGTSGPATTPGPTSQPAPAERKDELVSALSDAELRAEEEKREGQKLEQAAQQIREAVRADPALADLTRQLAIDMTPEGLRIQILDEDRSPMFTTGSAAPNERARLLLQKVAPVLMRLSESISIAGHTDATPYRGTDKSNWELSTERANATRRLLLESGLPEGRVRSVTGNADRDPLLPKDPTAAANRRIAIVVLRAAAKSVGGAAPPTVSPSSP
ncbi:MAG TPA: flagellar motor protein MotB [Acetobacteraceae bacterium]|nr:flagellar motor protein MotB [Acetobacteraceae bacterium]